GQTASANFPTSLAAPQRSYGGGTCGTPPRACYDAFLAKLNSAGNALLYSTYLGRARDDIGNGIAVDSARNAYVTGQTDEPINFFTTPGAFQRSPPQPKYGASGQSAFVAKLNPAGDAWVFSTYLAGQDDDVGMSIAVDSAGNAYVTGSTTSDKFPVTNAF